MAENITIESLEDLEKATQTVTESEGVRRQAHAIIREIHKAHIVAIAKAHHKETGYYLTKELKKRLSMRFNYSVSSIEHIVHRNT